MTAPNSSLRGAYLGDRGPRLRHPDGPGTGEERRELARGVGRRDPEAGGGLELPGKVGRPDEGILQERRGRALVGVKVAQTGAHELDLPGGRGGFGDEEDRDLGIPAEVVRERERGRDGSGDLVHPTGASGQVVQGEAPGQGDAVSEEEEPAHPEGSTHRGG